MKYAGVIVDISLEQLDKAFTYAVPKELEDKLFIGSRVRIPFGNSTRTGYVVEEIENPSIEISRIKPIREIMQESVSVDERMIRLAYWMKEHYGGTMKQALATVLPVKEKVKAEVKYSVRLLIPKPQAKLLLEECRDKHKVAQARLLEVLVDNPVADYTLLNQKLSISMNTIKSLVRKEVIALDSITAFRNTLYMNSRKAPAIELNDRQRHITEQIATQMDQGDSTPCLIKGVTGSGKTEIYMALIAHALSQGKEAICLIPEIALTYQTVMRFYERFGDVVSIIHSRLSKGEKYDRFALAKEGKIKIMIGPRSALFTPFEHLGLVIIDEEHEGAYQCETVPKYHARETAIALADITKAKVVLGSATPSLEAYYRARRGDYYYYVMNQRAGVAKLPKVHVVDLRKELKNGNRSVFSEQLRNLIADRLMKKEQIMLFLNRRGYQGFINCRDCGETLECPHCAVSLTEHRGGKLVCHYCGYEETFTRICPHCGSKRVGTFKAGTQKIEEEMLKQFPKARILRMDLDTTKGKDGHAKIIEQFANQEADVLIGTQMIVKGHDFPHVTLMGILLADTSLHAPDYTAAERTFQLLTQAAGRAGRGNQAGEVVIQTYDPTHYAITHAAKQDYDSFYEAEIDYRHMMGYPPTRHMMCVKIASARLEDADKISLLIRELTCKEEVQVIGPTDAPIARVNDIYYKLIYYKCTNYEELIRKKNQIEAFMKEDGQANSSCQLQFDFR